MVDEGIYGTFCQVVENGEPQQYEKHYVHEQFDGWFHQSVVKLNDGVVTTTANITARKKAEEETREQAHFIRSVTDNASAIISITEFPSGVAVFSNRDPYTALGFHANELIYMDREELLVLVHPDDRQRLRDYHMQFKTLRDQEEVGIEYRLKNKNGEWVWLDTRGKVFKRDGNGNAFQLLHIAQDITQKKTAEQENLRLRDEIARHAEDKYRILFNSIDEGFVIQELIYNAAGKPVDVRLEEANPAHGKLTGLKNVIGKTSSELGMATEASWFEKYDFVLKTGEPLRFTDWHAPTRRWYDVFLSRIGGPGSARMAMVFSDITERKLHEQRQAFLLQLSDALRPFGDTAAIRYTAVQVLGQHMKAQRVAYAENVDGELYEVKENYVDGLPEVVGRYRYADYGKDIVAMLRRGQNRVQPDIAHDQTLSAAEKAALAANGVGASMNIPLVKNGELVAFIGVNYKEPHEFTPEEIGLVEETAERTWAAVERAKVEDALRQSQERFQSIANLVPDLLWDSQPDGSTNWYNDRWLTYTGQSFEEAIGWGWVDAIHPDDRKGSARRYREAVEAGKLAQQEHRIRRHDGAYRWFVVSASPLKDQYGRVVKMYGAATDIHDRKVAEAAMQKSEKRLRLAIEATELATWEWHLETNQVYWNDQHFRLFGMDPRPNPVSSEDFMRHVHPRDKDRVSTLLNETISGRGVYDAEFCAVLEDGCERWMSGYGRITEKRDGRAVRMSGVMFDVDERRRAEDALRLADRRKDEFLAMLAHELRNPMATLRSGLQILTLIDHKDEASRATMAASTVAMMNRQTDHLVRMVDDLLDVSRISRDKIELKIERVDLVEIVSQAAESVKSLFREPGKLLQLDLPSAPIYLEGDNTRLTQAVTNLLTNGARYTGDQGQVWLSLSHQGQEAVLLVSDNGIGLAENQLSAIFDLFVQVDNSTARSKGGLGLGLTLVKRLVEMHGGRVEARSEGLGKGSTFAMHLPTLMMAADPPVIPAPGAVHPSGAQRILVIDDNADVAYSLAMLLKLKGYEAHTRNSGRSGIEAAESLQPMVILLDIGMPEMDGYATCGAIRKEAWGRDMVIIALTGYGQEEDRQHAREAGFDGHLVKPVDLGTLSDLLSELLGRPF